MSALKTLWLTAEQLLERWEIDALGLYQILYSELHEDLPLYNLNFQKITEWFFDAEPGKDAVLDFHQFVFHPNDPIFSDINIHPLKRLLPKLIDSDVS